MRPWHLVDGLRARAEVAEVDRLDGLRRPGRLIVLDGADHVVGSAPKQAARRLVLAVHGIAVDNAASDRRGCWRARERPGFRCSCDVRPPAALRSHGAVGVPRAPRRSAESPSSVMLRGTACSVLSRPWRYSCCMCSCASAGCPDPLTDCVCSSGVAGVSVGAAVVEAGALGPARCSAACSRARTHPLAS